AALVEPLRVDDAAGRDGDVVRREALEHALGVAPLEQELAERGLVEEADALAHGAVLGGRMVEPVLPSVGVFVFRNGSGGGVPVRPLPPRRLAETGAARGEAVVQ